MTTTEKIERNANLTLWCVHILGPDDVIATASHEEAVDRAREINEAGTEASGRCQTYCILPTQPLGLTRARATRTISI